MLLHEDALALAVGDALRARGAKVAVAETTAGGLICARMVSVAGASDWFERGIIAYSAAAKKELGVDAGLLREHGAVSVPVVLAMARAVRALALVEYGVAESGIAGPQGNRRSAKPAGSVAIAVVGPGGEHAEEHVFAGTRVEVMEQITRRALEILLEVVSPT